MKFFPLIWSNLRRKSLRTIFTILSILVAFLLFGYLAAVRLAFDFGVQIAGVDRLILTHKVSLIQPLPLSYKDEIAGVPGVVKVTHASWFGGIYQDPKNFFAQMAVEPEKYLELYPEFLLPENQKQAWFKDRTGAIVGKVIADRYHWKVGDRVPIQATIWKKGDGSSTWEFTVDGIYTAEAKTADLTQFLFHYDFFNETRTRRKGMVGWYIVRINPPDQAPQIANRIDGHFANSANETKTSTEKAFMQAFAKQVGDIGAIIKAILSAVFFTILLVSGNTMMQSVRERITELAVLKTIGFSSGTVLALVLGESLLLAGLGGGLGLALAWLLIGRGDPTGGALPVFFLPPKDLLLGVFFVALLGLVTGIVPALQAMRLHVVDALRRG